MQSNKQKQKQYNDQQECWLSLNFSTILLPNIIFESQNTNIYLKVSLIQRNGTYFDYLQKTQPQQLATIAHENVTDLNNQITRIYEQVLSMHTQQQAIKPNNFTTYEPIYKNCRISDFLNEQIIFNDSQQNLLQRAYVLIQVVELPTWKSLSEKTKAIGCFKLSNVIQLSSQQLYLKLYPYSGTSASLDSLQLLLNQICLQVQDLQQLDASMLLDVTSSIEKQQIQDIGLLYLKFKLLDKEQIVHQRYVHEHPKYPYDKEIDAQKYDIEQDTPSQKIAQINTQQIQLQVKQLYDQMHYHSINAGQYDLLEKNVKTQISFSTVSALATPTQGNISLLAAAIQTPLQSFIICLFDQINMQLLQIIGYHSSYIYGLQFSQDNTLLLSYGSDGCINIYDVRQYVYYGFNYFCEQKLPLEQFTQIQQNFKEQQLTQDMANWLSSSLQSQYSQEYGYSTIYSDYQTLSQVSVLYQQFDNDLNKLIQNADENTIYELQQEHLLTQIEIGVPVYSLVQINKSRSIEVSRQLIHKNQLFQEQKYNNIQPLKIVYGNLLGQVIQSELQFNINGTVSNSQQILVVHQSYIIKILYLNKNLIVAEQSGKISFYSLQDGQVKTNFEIDTHQNLKDIQLIKSSNNSVIVTYSSNGNISIFNTNGRLITNIVEQPQQVVKIKEHRLNVPGVQRISPGKDYKYVIIPTYAGGLLSVTASGRIKKQYYCFGQEQYGHFTMCSIETKFGIVSCFCSITQLGQKTVSQYLPSGIATTGELPIIRIINEEVLSTSGVIEQETGQEIDVSKGFMGNQKDIDLAIRAYMQFLQENKRNLD